MKDVYVLGINSAFHEPAACLLKNGWIVAAVEEERFNRIRHGKFVSADSPHELPYASIDYCLKAAGISFKDIDRIGYSFSPKERLEKTLALGGNARRGELGSVEGERRFYRLLMRIPALLEKKYGSSTEGKFYWIPHHLAHSASAFFASPYREAAILSTDGIGEFACNMFANGKGNKITVIKETGYPNSIGFLWNKASQYLGLTVGGRAEYGAGKVMALAAYGTPHRFYKKFKGFVKWDGNGNLFIDDSVAQFRSGSLEGFEKNFGRRRNTWEQFEQRHMDFAAALQKVTNEVLLSFAGYLHRETGSKNLCRAGGVALNCTSNTHVLEKSPFERIFVEPAANDMGTALGAALYVWHHILDMPRNRCTTMENAYLGSEYSNHDIERALRRCKRVKYEKTGDIARTAAFLISRGLVVGWFQGKMEFGPRALGNRSVLADPRRPELYKKVSMDIKGREFFRPLAPSILEERVDEFFERPKGGSDSDQYMIFSYRVRDDKLGTIPAVTHVDNTGRIQVVSKRTNRKFHSLIRHFGELTGVPIVVNTSFNAREPIVENPEHALDVFLNTPIDVLAIGDFIVVKKEPEEDCRLYESRGRALSLHDFVREWIDNAGLADHEKNILRSMDFPKTIPLFLRKVRSRAEWLRKGGGSLRARISGQRSAYLSQKRIKFKGCNPTKEGLFFPRETFFFGEEKESEGLLPFGVLTAEQVMRELLGWAFFVKNNLKPCQKPLCVYDYGDNAFCLVLESNEEKRIEKFFDFRKLRLVDLVSGRPKMPAEVGLRNLGTTSYADRKASLLAEMNFLGGFRDLLDSNIGNDVLDGGVRLCDFSSFRAVEIPEKPDRDFLKRFYLQCVVEAIKSSLPIVDAKENRSEVYLKKSSVFRAYLKVFNAHARERGWSAARLGKIREWAKDTPVFRRALRKMVPEAHRMLIRLPSEEPAYRIH
ncbi:MAG: carbamoyltransferase C-terminal domain-containing protein [Candidatus Micrarchaeota archaeon]